jgi:hypothetical protein
MTPTPEPGPIAQAQAREQVRRAATPQPSGTPACVRANKSTPTSLRVVCGARRRRDGQPGEALSVPGKRRCKWHGGCSTGPRTAEGKARALANLRQNARKPSLTESGAAVLAD